VTLRGLKGGRWIWPLLLALAVTTPGAAQTRPEGVVVYLVRHAERATDDPTDPTLTPEGSARAELLARVFGDAGITHIHSTALRRTRLTAAPLAARLGLPVEDYAGGELAELAERIRATPGRHFVSGHSNTTHDMVRLLGGEPGELIAEAEYDRLYIVSIGADGAVTTSLLRYGAPLHQHLTRR
jgi:phosphohistidine phosphatase SixA